MSDEHGDEKRNRQKQQEDRQQEQANRQARIRAAVAGFFKNSLPALKAKRVQPEGQQESLFAEQEHED